MGILNWLTDILTESETNPANGLPMTGGRAGTDAEGNPYGSDGSHINLFDDDSHIDHDFDDTFSSSFDDW